MTALGCYTISWFSPGPSSGMDQQGGQGRCLRPDPRPPVQHFNTTVKHRTAAGEVPRDHAVNVLGRRLPLKV